LATLQRCAAPNSPPSTSSTSRANPAASCYNVRQSKTDQHAEGQVASVACGQYADTDPFATLDAWLDCRGREAGPLFTSMRNKAVTDERVSGNAIARMLSNRSRDAASRPSGSPRTACAPGTHHRRPRRGQPGPDRRPDPAQAAVTLLERYIRPAQALDLTSSRDFGR
jgi:hypothetical protein